MLLVMAALLGLSFGVHRVMDADGSARLDAPGPAGAESTAPADEGHGHEVVGRGSGAASSLPAFLLSAPKGQRLLEQALALPPGDPQRGFMLGELGRCRALVWLDAGERWARRRASEGGVLPSEEEAELRRLFLLWVEATRRLCEGLDTEAVARARAEHRALIAGDHEPGEPGFIEAQLIAIGLSPERDALLADPGIRAMLWDFVHSSGSGAQTEHALTHLAAAGAGPFARVEARLSPYAGHPGPGNLAERRLQVARAAAVVFACRTHGGCGPGSLRAFAEGAPVSQLQWQMGVEGLYRESFSPQQWRVIERVVEDLRRCLAERSCEG